MPDQNAAAVVSALARWVPETALQLVVDGLRIRVVVTR